jgi:hypothetical protein
MTDLRFSWELKGTGWATCRIADGFAERRYTVSYVTDAFSHVLRAVAGLYGPDPVIRLSFDLEPAEIRWVLRCTGPDVDMKIYRFPDRWFSSPNDADGTLEWASRQNRGVLSHAVIEAAQSVLRLHGEEGYRAKWVSWPFPAAALQDLRRLHLRDDACDSGHDMSLP